MESAEEAAGAEGLGEVAEQEVDSLIGAPAELPPMAERGGAGATAGGGAPEGGGAEPAANPAPTPKAAPRRIRFRSEMPKETPSMVGSPEKPPAAAPAPSASGGGGEGELPKRRARFVVGDEASRVAAEDAAAGGGVGGGEGGKSIVPSAESIAEGGAKLDAMLRRRPSLQGPIPDFGIAPTPQPGGDADADGGVPGPRARRSGRKLQRSLTIGAQDMSKMTRRRMTMLEIPSMAEIEAQDTESDSDGDSPVGDSPVGEADEAAPAPGRRGSVSKGPPKPTQRQRRGSDGAIGTKKTMAEIVAIFNCKMKRGVEEVLKSRRVQEDAAAVAHWLRSQPGLDKTAVGDYLGEPDSLWPGNSGSLMFKCGDVLRAFVAGHDFTGLGFDDALRWFLSDFRLPGEAQKIDRFMQTFAGEYHSKNPKTFANEDTGYTMAFSLIMLNTDHFNASIKKERKMTRDQFISINRATDDHLTPEYLGTMYDRVCANEIKMTPLDMEDGSDASSMGSTLLYSNPHKHGYLRVRGLRKKGWERLWFVLKDQSLYFLEQPPALGAEATLVILLPLNDLLVTVDAAQLGAVKSSERGCCFALAKPLPSGRDKGELIKASEMTKSGMVPLTRELVICEADSPEQAEAWSVALGQRIASTCCFFN